MDPQLDWRYPFVMLAALVAAGVLLSRSQRALPIDGWQKYGLGLGAFCGGFLGAKVPFLLGDIEGVCNGSAFWTGGKTIMAGIVGAYGGVEIAKWALEVRVRTGDSFAVPCAVGVAIGRVACFVGGCCFGQPTKLPWGVVFPTAGDSLPRHPTQLYEAAFHGLAAVALLILQSQGRFRGQRIKLYILAYLGYRFVTEFLRPESQVLLHLTSYQWAAIALAPVFAWLWRRDAQQDLPLLNPKSAREDARGQSNPKSEIRN